MSSSSQSFNAAARPSSSSSFLSSTEGVASFATSRQRPKSDITSYKSEAEEIDMLFDDLKLYEQRVNNIDREPQSQEFQEELTQVENWYRVLSDPERTITVYSLLKGASQSQCKFFLTLLQQMAEKDASLLSRSLSSGGAATSTSSEGRLFSRRLSNEFLMGSSGSHLPVQQRTDKEDPLASSWKAKMTQRSSSLNMPLADIPIQPLSAAKIPLSLNIETPNKPSAFSLPPRHPSSVKPKSPTSSSPSFPSYMLPHSYSSAANAAENLVDPAGRSLKPFNDDTPGSLSSGRRPVPITVAAKSPISVSNKQPETIDINEIRDIPTWFRSLRLHKYSSIFEKDDWRQIILLSEEELIQRGVAALGARRKMLKVFEAVRNELDARQI